MKKLTALIVEDEQMSREVLFNYLHQYCSEKVEIVDMANSILQAKKAIDKHHPDLVFLDIEMPHGSGFDLLNNLEIIDFEIIFVTAYNQYAIQAVNEANALYYLLKPIEISALEKAVEKVYIKVFKNAIPVNPRPLPVRKLRLPVREGFEIIELDQLMYCEADGNYTHFYLKDKKKLTICKTLKYYTQLLDAYRFVRVNKSNLLNISYVNEFRRSDGGLVILPNGKKMSISPKYRDAFMNEFFGESIG